MRKLMYTAGTADVPIIVMTGQRFGGKANNALKHEMESRHDVVAFLTKPFECDELIGEMRRHIALEPVGQGA